MDGFVIQALFSVRLADFQTGMSITKDIFPRDIIDARKRQEPVMFQSDFP